MKTLIYVLQRKHSLPIYIRKIVFPFLSAQKYLPSQQVYQADRRHVDTHADLY